MSWEEILLQLSLSSDADEESYISESSTGKFLSGFNNEGSQIDVSLFSTTRQLIRFFPRVMQIEPTSINSMYPYALRIAHQLGECKIATESLEQQQQIIQDLHYLKYMDTEQERTLREPPAVSPIKNLSPPHPSSTGTSPFKEPMNETSTQTDKKPKKKDQSSQHIENRHQLKDQSMQHIEKRPQQRDQSSQHTEYLPQQKDQSSQYMDDVVYETPDKDTFYSDEEIESPTPSLCSIPPPLVKEPVNPQQPKSKEQQPKSEEEQPNSKEQQPNSERQQQPKSYSPESNNDYQESPMKSTKVEHVHSQDYYSPPASIQQTSPVNSNTSSQNKPTPTKPVIINTHFYVDDRELIEADHDDDLSLPSHYGRPAPSFQVSDNVAIEPLANDSISSPSSRRFQPSPSTKPSQPIKNTPSPTRSTKSVPRSTKKTPAKKSTLNHSNNTDGIKNMMEEDDNFSEASQINTWGSRDDWGQPTVHEPPQKPSPSPIPQKRSTPSSIKSPSASVRKAFWQSHVIPEFQEEDEDEEEEDAVTLVSDMTELDALHDSLNIHQIKDTLQVLRQVTMQLNGYSLRGAPVHHPQMWHDLEQQQYSLWTQLERLFHQPFSHKALTTEQWRHILKSPHTPLKN